MDASHLEHSYSFPSSNSPYLHSYSCPSDLGGCLRPPIPSLPPTSHLHALAHS